MRADGDHKGDEKSTFQVGKGQGRMTCSLHSTIVRGDKVAGTRASRKAKRDSELKIVSELVHDQSEVVKEDLELAMVSVLQSVCTYRSVHLSLCYSDPYCLCSVVPSIDANPRAEHLLNVGVVAAKFMRNRKLWSVAWTNTTAFVLQRPSELLTRELLID
jgi:hypothetical protein